jgi:hypothetical protein
MNKDVLFIFVCQPLVPQQFTSVDLRPVLRANTSRSRFRTRTRRVVAHTARGSILRVRGVTRHRHRPQQFITTQHGQTYTVGTRMSYQGSNYECLQTHTACIGCGWYPPAAPSLWRLL